MCLFRKKKVAVKTQDDKELIAVNSKSIEALIVLAKDNIDIVETLKELQEKIKYLTPSNNFKVIDYDKLIKNKIDDLRMVLIKFDSVGELHTAIYKRYLSNSYWNRQHLTNIGIWILLRSKNVKIANIVLLAKIAVH